MMAMVVTAGISAGLLLTACGDSASGPVMGQDYQITFHNLNAIPTEQGTLVVWVVAGQDTLEVATLPAGTGPMGPVTFENPAEDAREVLVTVEPPSDVNEGPWNSVLLRGNLGGGGADLVTQDVVHSSLPLQENPGAHSLFTTSNNSEGYPSAENAGLWLFTLIPSENVHGTREVRLTPLTPGWTYEGWIVWQGDPKVWISYGKYRPDEAGLLSSRDDSGTGPFGGTEDFRNAGVEDVPGEEWTSDEIALQLGIELPGGFDLPLALDSVDATGKVMWHHAISIEPAFDLVEGPLEGKPFVVRPYENEIGAGGPGVPRVIRMAHDPPTASVRPVSR
jgi:hypothetical protein